MRPDQGLPKTYLPILLAFCILAFSTTVSPTVKAGILENADTTTQSVQILHYKVIDKAPHMRKAFTQGFAIHKGTLYESSGGYGQSFIFSTDLESGRILIKKQLPKRLFAEGLTYFKDRLYLLSWRAQKGFVYDPLSLQKLGNFTYSGEGWGLSGNQTHLIMSNGSDEIRFLDPQSFKIERSLRVHENHVPLKKINELEWVEDKIYANIWLSNWLIIIDPDSGAVIAKADLGKLLPETERQADTDVLNGIAYDQQRRALWVTGKRWPWRYQIKLLPQESNMP